MGVFRLYDFRLRVEDYFGATPKEVHWRRVVLNSVQIVMWTTTAVFLAQDAHTDSHGLTRFSSSCGLELRMGRCKGHEVL